MVLQKRLYGIYENIWTNKHQKKYRQYNYAKTNKVKAVFYYMYNFYNLDITHYFNVKMIFTLKTIINNHS